MHNRSNRWMRLLIGMALLAAALYTGFSLVRATLHTWGSTAQEVAAVRPGDDRISQPLLRWDHALTIAAPVEQVWPWIAQLGDVRGAYYSYEFIENLIAGEHMYVNANQILPQYQQPQAGDGMIMDFVVIQDVQAGEYLLAVNAPAKMAMSFTWLWQLEPLDAEHTRLIVRMMVGGSPTASMDLPAPLGKIIDVTGFVMERKMMTGIKLRAEGGQEPGWYQPVEISLWLLTLAIGLTAAVWFVRRPQWILPLIVGLLALFWLFYLTFVQPSLWLRAAGVILLCAALLLTHTTTTVQPPAAPPPAE